MNKYVFTFVAIIFIAIVVTQSSCTKKPKPEAAPPVVEVTETLADEPECLNDDDCGGSQVCHDGYCVASPSVVEAAAPRKLPLHAVYFDFNDASLTLKAQDVLRRNAANFDGSPVTITGHCDSRGTQEYNLGLGERRARAVRRYLKHLGVDGGMLGLVSKGENELVCHGDSEACHQRNRRVMFVGL